MPNPSDSHRFSVTSASLIAAPEASSRLTALCQGGISCQVFWLNMCLKLQRQNPNVKQIKTKVWHKVVHDWQLHCTYVCYDMWSTKKRRFPTSSVLHTQIEVANRSVCIHKQRHTHTEVKEKQVKRKYKAEEAREGGLSTVNSQLNHQSGKNKPRSVWISTNHGQRQLKNV